MSPSSSSSLSSEPFVNGASVTSSSSANNGNSSTSNINTNSASSPFLQFKLINPFLNAVFATNDPLKSGLKDIYLSLLQDPFSFAFLVPSTHILLNHIDSVSGLPYRDLCFKQDFLKDHILDLRHHNHYITRSANISAILNTKKPKSFKTVSNKEVLLKRNEIILNSGDDQTDTSRNNSIADRLLRIKVSQIELFINFNTFFPKNSEFLLIHIDQPLVGFSMPETMYRHLSLLHSSPSATPTHSRNSSYSNVILTATKNGYNFNTFIEKDTPLKASFPSAAGAASALELEQPKVTYTQLTGRFPLIKQLIGEDFLHLFKNFVIESINDPREILMVYKETINQSALIFKSLDEQIIAAIIDYDPTIDLNRCIYDYVELNLFDKVWNQLKKVHNRQRINSANDNEQLLTNEIYHQLQSLSITQVGLFDDSPINPAKDQKQLIILLGKIAAAVKVFQNLPLANSYAEKSKILLETINELTKSVSLNDYTSAPSLDVNADMLVALMVLVVIQSKVEHIEVHLEYIKNFSYKNTEIGFMGYAISTLDAVLFHLQNKENLIPLIECSGKNAKLWDIIKAKDLVQLNNFISEQLDAITTSVKGEAQFLPMENCFKAITNQGESCLMLAIKYANYEVFKTLIDHEHIFPLEDILYDFDNTGTTLLQCAVISEKNSVADELVLIISSSASIAEQIEYYNSRDAHHGRNVGHYLFHYEQLLDKIGLFINWTDKDNINNHTPLMSLCRNYDINNYDTLISNVFKIVDQWYRLQPNGRKFSYLDHIDNKGNTLLHILKNNLQLVLDKDLINVNEFNYKNYSPLELFIKYYRIDNIKEILQDSRLNLHKTDPRTFLTILDFVKMSSTSNSNAKGNNGNTEVNEIERLIDGYCLKESFPLVDGKKFGILRAKLDNNQWGFIIKGMIVKKLENDHKKLKIYHYSNYHSLCDFRDLIRLLHIEYPVSSLPIAYLMECFAKLNLTEFAFFNFNKLKINELVFKLNIFLVQLLCSKDFNSHELVWEFLILPTINSQSLETRSRLKIESHKEKLGSPQLQLSAPLSSSSSSLASPMQMISESPIFNNSPNIPDEFTDAGLENLEELFLIDKSKNYSTEEMQDIFTFLRYSLDELESFQKVFKKVVQLTIVAKHKHDDLNQSFKVLADTLADSPLLLYDKDDLLKNNGATASATATSSTLKLQQPSKPSLVFEDLIFTLRKAFSENTDPIRKFIFIMQHLESCIDRLVKNIGSVLNKKVLRWVKLDEEVKGAKFELMRLRPHEFSHTNGATLSPLLSPVTHSSSVSSASPQTEHNVSSPSPLGATEPESHNANDNSNGNADLGSVMTEEDYNVFRTLAPQPPQTPLRKDMLVTSPQSGTSRASTNTLSANGSENGEVYSSLNDNFSTVSNSSSSTITNASKNRQNNTNTLAVPSSVNSNTNQVRKKRSFLSNLIESRRTSHEAKILKQYKITRLKLMLLSGDVRFNHESLATEMSSFLEFKKLFLRYAVKVFVKDEIKNLKFEKMIFENGVNGNGYRGGK